MVSTGFQGQETMITDGFGGNSFNSQHIIRHYGLDKPHDLDAQGSNIAQLFSATDRYSDKPMIGMTEAKGKTTTITTDTYTWKARGHQRLKARVTEVVETATQPGITGTTFDIVIDKPWYKSPDILSGQNNNYPIQIVSPAELGRANPVQYNTGWRYTVKLQGTENNRSFPTSLLQVGKEFWKVATLSANEDNNEYGTMHFSSVFEMYGQTGYVAEELKVTDRMLRVDKNSNSSQQVRHWRVPFIDKNGKKYMNFMPLAEAELWNNVYSDIEYLLNYGRFGVERSNQGYFKRCPAGLRQRLADGHQLTHSGNLTLARLDEWLNNIYRGRTDATPSQRKLVLVTGERGARMFDAMIASDASAFFSDIGNIAITGGDPRHLAYGLQFTQYRGKNGLDVTVMLNPMYDNPYFCPQMHPLYPNTPLDSWRMDILDFGSTKEQDTGVLADNISFLKEGYGDVYFSHSGKWDKATGMPINNGGPGMAGGISGYSCHIEKSFGLMIRDISRCGTIKLSIDE